MGEKIKKYKELLDEMLLSLMKPARVIENGDIDLRIELTMRELRQMIERLRRLKDGESLRYEPIKQEEPKI